MKRNAYLLLVISVCIMFAACKKVCEHEYQAGITKDPVCDMEGVKTFACTICEESYTEAIPALNHEFGNEEIIKESTCKEAGVKKCRCVLCGKEEERPAELVEHSFGETTVTKQPNCTEEGELSKICKACGTGQVVEKIKQNGIHSYIEKVVRAATCAKAGEGENVCSLCQHTEKYEIQKMSHTYSSAKVKKEATCLKNGVQVTTCTSCGYDKEESITATGHQWTTGTCQTASKCSACGVAGEKGAHHYITMYESKGSTHFAGQRDEMCDYCENKRTIYTLDGKDLDLEAIANEIGAHARKKGFNVAYGENPYKEIGQLEYIRSLYVNELRQPAWSLDWLTEAGKNGVNVIYDEYGCTPEKAKLYTIYVNVYYWQSGSLETGGFAVNITEDS